jgi:hypothetical protein
MVVAATTAAIAFFKIDFFCPRFLVPEPALQASTLWPNCTLQTTLVKLLITA